MMMMMTMMLLLIMMMMIRRCWTITIGCLTLMRCRTGSPLYFSSGCLGCSGFFFFLFLLFLGCWGLFFFLFFYSLAAQVYFFLCFLIFVSSIFLQWLPWLLRFLFCSCVLFFFALAAQVSFFLFWMSNLVVLESLFLFLSAHPKYFLSISHHAAHPQYFRAKVCHFDAKVFLIRVQLVQYKLHQDFG